MENPAGRAHGKAMINWDMNSAMPALGLHAMTAHAVAMEVCYAFERATFVDSQPTQVTSQPAIEVRHLSIEHSGRNFRPASS